MWFANMLKPRHKVDQSNIRYVKGEVFDPGAEVYAAEDTLANPQYTLRTFPQWNFTPLRVYAGSPMVFQNLSLIPQPPQGFVYGGVESTGLISSAQYPSVDGDYYQ